MKNYKIILIASLFLALLLSYIFSLSQIADLRKDRQRLVQILDKERKLEKLLFQDNVRLRALVVVKGKPVKALVPVVIKSVAVKAEPAISVPVGKPEKIKGNRGFLIKNGKPTTFR